MKKLLMLLLFLAVPAFGQRLEIKTYFQIGQSINERYASSLQNIKVDQTTSPSIKDFYIGDNYIASFKDTGSDFDEVIFPNSNLADCFDHVTLSFQDYSKFNISVHRTFTCRRTLLGYDTAIYLDFAQVGPSTFKLISINALTTLVKRENALTALKNIYGPVVKTWVEHNPGSISVDYTYYTFLSGKTMVTYKIQDSKTPMGSVSSSEILIQYAPLYRITEEEKAEFNAKVKSSINNKFTTL